MTRLLASLTQSSRLFTLSLMAILAMALLPTLPAQPVSAASGAITVEYHVCDDEFDAEAAEFGDLNANCTTPGTGETFSLTPTGGVATNLDTDASGAVSWPSSDPGDGTITMVNPDGFMVRVFCAVHAEGVPGIIDEVPQAIAGTIPYGIPDGLLMTCEWFGYQLVVAIPGSEIRLQKWVCPDDFDAGAAGTIDDISPVCTTPGADFPFARVPDGGDPPVELAADAGGAITWPEFPPGTGFVAETAAELSLSRVFCTSYDVGVIGLAVYNEVDATGNQIDYDLASGKGLDCEWFNYLPPVDYSDITLFKRACPDGDWSDATLDTLSADCIDAHADVSFFLSSPSTGLEGTTDAGGSVGWTVPSGDTYAVMEVTPSGYGKARIFCSTYDQNVGPGEYEAVDTPGNEISVTPESGFSIECYWFNTPAQLGTIVVDKYECPVGYGTNTGYDQLAANCTLPVSGVTFTLTPAGLAGIEGQTDNTGRLVFEEVPLGEGSLDEQVPQQFNWVEVYCAIADDIAAGPYQSQNITAQNEMGYLMEPSQVWSCSWFNLTLEAGPASLTINKFTCQSAHDPVEPLQTLINECAEPNQDVEFTLESLDLPDGQGSGAGASTGTGPGPSSVEFTDLEAGRYLLTEQIPDSVRLAYVSECRSDQRSFASPLYPFAFVEPDGRFVVELLPGENVECDWYNILAESPGSITITKYWCQGNVVNEASCELYDGGAAFTLIPAEGGQPISVETGEDGSVTVEAAGVFDVVEDDFEWCSAQSDAANADGLIEVAPGANATIEIYNCGPMPLQ